ncbi:MFS transporter [Saccharopolyspora shandongensis]|uniref:MFS transporter n=1 Tax=Saccharopolyspora shandongensis TaxID=418495 RepID=UPI0033CB6231
MTVDDAVNSDATTQTRRRVQRRTIRALICSQVLAGAGLSSGVVVGALLAEDMLESKRWAGITSALFTLGAAVAALLIGRLSQRSGRRSGLSVGFAVGALGALGIVAAILLDNAALLLISFLPYGAGTATNLQARYAGADLADPAHRGRALSIVLLATTGGTVLGPNLTEVTGSAAQSVGLPAFSGPFLLSAVAYGAAALLLTVLMRPDPLLTARELAAQQDSGAAQTSGNGPRGSLALGAGAMVLTQLVMVAVMTMTPIHMRDHGHGLAETGLVIAVHIAGMYLPSPLTGALADKFGRRAVIAAGGVVLLAAGLVAAFVPEHSVAGLAVGLGLLGLGWNLGLLGGTAMVTDAAPLANRARIQGRVDLAVSLAGATAGLSSGLVMASTSYSALAIGGGVLAVCVLPFLIRIGQASK